MPVLAQFRIIVEAAADADVGWCADRPKIALILAIFDDLFISIIVCIAVESTVDLRVQLAIFNLLGQLHVLNESGSSICLSISLRKVRKNSYILIDGYDVATLVV